MNDNSIFIRDSKMQRYSANHIILEFYKYYNDPMYYNKALDRAQGEWDKWVNLDYPDSPGNPTMPDGAFSVPILEAGPGDYYGPGGMMEMRGYPVKVKSNERSMDEKNAAKLWELSEKMTGVNYKLKGAQLGRHLHMYIQINTI